jgi:hypothetical protein
MDSSSEGLFTNDTPFTIRPCPDYDGTVECGEFSNYLLFAVKVEKLSGTSRRHGSYLYIKKR